MDLFQGLNECQQDAVRTTEGPELVLAGAGSGKTRVLTHRIAYLTGECGVDPQRILAITFTNKAAAEMKERVEKLCGMESGSMWVMTFHAACLRILKRNAVYLGYDDSFMIFDTEDQKSLIKKLIKEYPKSVDGLTPKGILTVISAAKNQCITPQQFAKENEGDYYLSRVAWFYERYDAALKQNKAMDFDDLLTKTVELFEAYPDILARYQERFRYILVDEYQDTNLAQYKIIKLLASKYGNIFVVGDDDQSIYRFRGADIRNILEFEKDFPGAHVVRLEQNYRSTSHILNMANTVISHNRSRKGKNLWTNEGVGEKVKFYIAHDENDEAQRVVQTIARLQSEGYNLKDIAILYRANSLSRIYEDVLARAGIPYRLIGGTAFYQRKEIKDIFAFLRLIANDHDYVSMERALTTPARGIGDKTIETLLHIAEEDGYGFSEIVDHIDVFPQLSRAAAKLSAFNLILLSWREKSLTLSVEELIRTITETLAYQEYLMKDDETTAEDRWENVQELISRASEFDEENELEAFNANEDDEVQAPKTLLQKFLEEIALQTAVDKYDENAPAVTMMTVHTAKGLEFNVVFLVGLEDGTFPSYQSINDDADEEAIPEERRLMYVAITRARRLLYMSYAENRRINGMSQPMNPSRFVGELSDEDMEVTRAKSVDSFKSKDYFDKRSVYADFGTGFSKPSSRQEEDTNFVNPFAKPKASLSQPTMDLAVGDLVSHQTFGLGVIKSMESVNADYRVVVDFNDYGPKTLFAKLAKLKKM